MMQEWADHLDSLRNSGLPQRATGGMMATTLQEKI